MKCAGSFIARAEQDLTGNDLQPEAPVEALTFLPSDEELQEPTRYIPAADVAISIQKSDNEPPTSQTSLIKDDSTTGALLPTVPWGLDTTVTVMALWLVCFWLAAYSFVPSVLHILGVETREHVASSATHALRHLLLDASQLGVTFVLLSRALKEHGPRALGLFSIKLRPIRSWLPIVLAGCACFPLVDWVHKQMVVLLAGGVQVVAGGGANNSGGGSIVAASGWEARTLWFLVLAVCAPLWEEVMFRGFLLPSLTRRMPPIAAIAMSSLVFALVHFTKEGFVPLLILGTVFGTAYVRTLNLFPAIALHSLWNVCLLAQILVSGGA